MKEIVFQIQDDYTFNPFSQEDLSMAKEYKPNQLIRCKTYGIQKPRSVQQNKYIHAIFRLTASNTDNPDWDTPEKVKRNVKMAMKFFKDDVIVYKNKVYFELRSFAFDKMEHNEANLKYKEAKNICAKFLKVKPEELEARAREEG